MKLLEENGTALTTHEDENGAEWDIKILFTYQPSEPMQTNPDHPMFGPGCDAGIVDMQVMRNEPFQGMTQWVQFNGATDKEEAAWAVEIHELINQQGEDDA